MAPLSFVLMICAYTALVAVVVFVAVYSKMYDWWASPMGRVMNLSLIANALVAGGIAIRFFEDQVPGRLLSIVGLIAFTVLLIWRLRLLISTAKKYPAKPSDEEPHH